MVNFTPKNLQEWVDYFKMIEGIRNNPAPTLPYLTPKALADSAAPTRAGLQTLHNRGGQLRLTSVLGAQDRDTLVAGDKAQADGFKGDMAELRFTPRLQRVPADLDTSTCFCVQI